MWREEDEASFLSKRRKLQKRAIRSGEVADKKDLVTLALKKARFGGQERIWN